MCSLTFTILWIPYVKAGGTHHFKFLDLPAVEKSLKYNWISQSFCVLGLIMGKISVGLLIRRIGISDIRMRYFLYFLMGSLTIIGILAIAFVWGQCTPVSRLWKPTAPGKCWNPTFLTAWAIICGSRCTLTLGVFFSDISIV